MSKQEINSGTEVLYAQGTSRRYWLKTKTDHSNPDLNSTDQFKQKAAKRHPWIRTYHLLSDRGDRVFTTNDEELIPVNQGTPADLFNPKTQEDENTPSAIRFLHRVQRTKFPDQSKGNQVRWQEDPNEDANGKPANDTYTVTGITTWVDESDESPMYGFWVVDIKNNRTGQEEQVCEDELEPAEAQPEKKKGTKP